MFKKFTALYGTKRSSHHVHMSQPLILSQINPLHTLPSYFFKIHFNIICPFMHRSSKLSLSFSFVHQNPTCKSLLLHTCHMSCLTYHPRFYHPKNMYWAVQIVQLLNMQVSPALSTFSLLGPNMFLSTLFSNSSSLCSPLMWETKFNN